MRSRPCLLSCLPFYLQPGPRSFLALRSPARHHPIPHLAYCPLPSCQPSGRPPCCSPPCSCLFNRLSPPQRMTGLLSSTVQSCPFRLTYAPIDLLFNPSLSCRPSCGCSTSGLSPTPLHNLQADRPTLLLFQHRPLCPPLCCSTCTILYTQHLSSTAFTPDDRIGVMIPPVHVVRGNPDFPSMVAMRDRMASN